MKNTEVNFKSKWAFHPNQAAWVRGDCSDPTWVSVYLTLPAPGFSGAMCQLDVDECASTPCRNGAKCVDQPDGYECRCAEGEGGPMTRLQESGGRASGVKGPILSLGESCGQSCHKAGPEQDQ